MSAADESSTPGTPPAPVPPTVAALRRSLEEVVRESQALREDVHAAERARRRQAQVSMALLGLLAVFTGLLIAIGWQNNQLAHQVAQTNQTLLDCTEPTGDCYRNSNGRIRIAIADIIRGQAFLSECSRLYPGEVGPAYDAKLEACLNDRIADRSRNPLPGMPTSPSPSPGQPASPPGGASVPPASTPTGG